MFASMVNAIDIDILSRQYFKTIKIDSIRVRCGILLFL